MEKEYQSSCPSDETIATAIVNAAFKIHQALGPGLLEKIYEACLEHELKKAGFRVRRQIPISFSYDGLIFDEGLRVDLLVEDKVIVELKAVETINPVWSAQILSHLKLTNLQLGFLINFNVPLIKQGIQRFRL